MSMQYRIDALQDDLDRMYEHLATATTEQAAQFWEKRIAQEEARIRELRHDLKLIDDED